MNPAARFTGQTVLITGGASGLGLAAALAFGREGARIVVADINLEAAVAAAQRLGSFAAPIGVDVTDEASVDHANAQGPD